MIIAISGITKTYFITMFFFKQRNSSKFCPRFVTYLDLVCPFSLLPQYLLANLVLSG